MWSLIEREVKATIYVDVEEPTRNRGGGSHTQRVTLQPAGLTSYI